MSKLRKVVEPAQIERDVLGYTLAGNFTTDVDEFERLVAAGDVAAAERLVRGEPLAELMDVAAIAPERARLAELIAPVTSFHLVLNHRFELDDVARRRALGCRDPDPLCRVVHNTHAANVTIVNA